jgi:muconolactone delta-isomerase
MGKAPAWTMKERETVALAWLRATNNGIQGADQKSEDFRNKIHGFLKALSPKDCPPGRFYERPSKAVYVFLRDNIFPDINKFHEALRLVQASHPTGVNEDNILSMAIAVHLGKTKRMDYQFKFHEHTKWPNYFAWKILRVSPKFRPPSPSSDESPPSLPAVLAPAPPQPYATPVPRNNVNMEHPEDATTIDPTGARVPHMISVPADTTHLQTPSIATLPSAVQTEKLDESIYSNQLRMQVKEYFEQSRSFPSGTYAAACNVPSSVAKEPSLVPSSASASILDPSRGGRGAAMGTKKAKMEYHRNMMDAEKIRRLKGIEFALSKQMQQNGEMQQVFKLRQLMKLAKTLKNNRLIKKVENEINDLLATTDTKESNDNTTQLDHDDDADSFIPPPTFGV